MGTCVYFDCFSGASGDMILGSLVDAGLPLEELRQALSGLNMDGEFSLSAESVQRGALRATLLHVSTHHEHDQHDEHHSHHRHLSDITALIEASSLPASVRQKSLAIFQRLAEAEARVHGMPLENVHFHEVGAVDSIVDIVGAVWGLEHLGAEQIYASPLPLGGGSIGSSHGTLPLPAPATMELLALAGAPTRPWPTDKELVTPTGAAILTTLARFSQPALRLQRVGIGAGQRELPWPNVLRLWVGEPLEAELAPHTALSVLETNLDNMNPEFYGHVMARLFEAGALDVYLAPVYMKKNRPGTMLGVVARPEDEAALAALMLRETSTLGVRAHRSLRYELERELRLVDTPYGALQVKLKWLGGQVVSAAPEYEACRKIAAEHGVPLADVYRAADQAAAGLLGIQQTAAGEEKGHG